MIAIPKLRGSHIVDFLPFVVLVQAYLEGYWMLNLLWSDSEQRANFPRANCVLTKSISILGKKMFGSVMKVYHSLLNIAA